MEIIDQRHAPAALPPGKTRYPLYRSLGGPQGRSRHVRKISPPTGIRSLDRPAHTSSYRPCYNAVLQIKGFHNIHIFLLVTSIKTGRMQGICSS